MVVLLVEDDLLVQVDLLRVIHALLTDHLGQTKFGTGREGAVRAWNGIAGNRSISFRLSRELNN